MFLSSGHLYLQTGYETILAVGQNGEKQSLRVNENVKCICDSDEVILFGSWGGHIDLCFKEGQDFVEYTTFKVKSDVRKIVQTS